MNINFFIKSLKEFSSELSYSDQIWRVIFPNKKKWEYIVINKYEESFYLGSVLNDIPALERHVSPFITWDPLPLLMKCSAFETSTPIWIFRS